MSSEDRLTRAEEIIANLAVVARDVNKRSGAPEGDIRSIDVRLDKLVRERREGEPPQTGL